MTPDALAVAEPSQQPPVRIGMQDPAFDGVGARVDGHSTASHKIIPRRPTNVTMP